MLDYIEASIDAVTSAYPSATVILAGDFNTLADSEIVSRNALISIVNRPTRGAHKLDRICVNDATYTTVSVVTSTVKSDHKVVIAYSGPRLKPDQQKSRAACVQAAFTDTTRSVPGTRISVEHTTGQRRRRAGELRPDVRCNIIIVI